MENTDKLIETQKQIKRWGKKLKLLKHHSWITLVSPVIIMIISFILCYISENLIVEYSLLGTCLIATTVLWIRIVQMYTEWVLYLPGFIIIQQGIINPDMVRINWQDVQNINIEHNVIEKIFNCGRVNIIAKGKYYHFKKLHNPHKAIREWFINTEYKPKQNKENIIRETKTCICCGEQIPEGRQVCPICENKEKYKEEG